MDGLRWGDRLFFFYATGVMPFYMFIHVMDHSQNRFLDNLGLLQIPLVTRFRRGAGNGNRETSDQRGDRRCHLRDPLRSSPTVQPPTITSKPYMPCWRSGCSRSAWASFRRSSIIYTAPGPTVGSSFSDFSTLPPACSIFLKACPTGYATSWSGTDSAGHRVSSVPAFSADMIRRGWTSRIFSALRLPRWLWA